METSQIMYPMSMLHEMLTDTQIVDYSKDYSFNPEDEFFHFSHEYKMLESCDKVSIAWYNDGMPVADRLVIYKQNKRK